MGAFVWYVLGKRRQEIAGAEDLEIAVHRSILIEFSNRLSNRYSRVMSIRFLSKAFVVIGIAALLPANSNGGTAAPSSALFQQSISYQSDGLKITGLLSKPAGNGPFPLILINHGGYEPASTVGRLADLYAKLGYTAIASDYRAVGQSEGNHELAKGEVNDVLNAITYAGTLGYVDTNRVVMWGHSHGGCIALLAAARNSSLRALVTVGAPVELAECYRHWLKTVDQRPFLRPLTGLRLQVGGTPDQAPEAWKMRSPLYVADKIECPVLMVQGAQDEAVPPEQAERMVNAIQAAGNPQARLLLDAEAGHVLDAKAYDRLGRTMINFLNEHAGLTQLP
jgi:dipeptidyl aminopeptidase/acylaminoacyl peptidase